jgi:hypothetical protein
MLVFNMVYVIGVEVLTLVGHVSLQINVGWRDFSDLILG